MRCANYARCGRTVDNVGLKGPYCSLRCKREVVVAKPVEAVRVTEARAEVPSRVSGGPEVKAREVQKPAVRQVEK